ncbi:MAG: hypothetical protein AAFV88_05460 [Planctomycetota bacterium]
MVGEYKVNRCTRQCHAEERPLQEGEWYHSVVILSEAGDYTRRDYSDSAWDGPPEGTVGHWKSRMPIAGEKKLVLAPREVLIDLLRQMESDNEQIRYLLSLLLLRRKYVRLIGVSDLPSGDESNIQAMTLDLGDGTTVDVAEVSIPKSEMETLSQQLGELLYCEASDLEQARDSGECP